MSLHLPSASTFIEHLRGLSTTDAWPGDSLHNIRSWFLNEDERSQRLDAMCAGVDSVLATLPTTSTKEHPLADDSVHRLAQLLAPLTLWAQNEPWGANIRGSDVANTAQAYFLHPVYDAVGDPVHTGARILKQTVEQTNDSNQAWGLLGPWLLGSRHFWPRLVADWLMLEATDQLPQLFKTWVLLAHTAETADSKRTSEDKSVLLTERWNQQFKVAFAFASHSETMLLVGEIVHSEMSDTMKLATFKKLSPAAWLHPDAVEHFNARLPNDDVTRASTLPWSPMFSSLNQELAAAYLPETAQLLNSLAPPDVWSSQPVYTTWVQSVVNARARMHAPLDLGTPSELFVDPTA